MVGSVFRPTILVDMRKNRIRIHKNTLHALGDPEFVVLIINPEAHTLGIKCSMLDDKLAHRIRKGTMNSRVCYELYSKPFMAALHELCPDWDKKKGYRIKGEIIIEEKIAVFSLNECTMLAR